MQNRTRLLGLVAILLLGLMAVSGVRAQDSTPEADSIAMAGHPIIGTWIVTDPSGSPSITSFTADGIVMDIEADGGTALGTWMPTGVDSVDFTMVLVVSSDGFNASVQINVTVIIDPSGQAGAGDYGYTVVLADGSVADAGIGTVTIARMPILGIDDVGTPMAEYPVWTPNQDNGGPEATPTS